MTFHLIDAEVMWQKALLLVFYQLCVVTIIGQKLIDKKVDCKEGSLTVSLEFDTIFNGLVYANNYNDRSRCRTQGRSREVRLSLRHDSCGMYSSQNGKLQEVTVVAQRNAKVITQADNFFRVTCDYLLSHNVSLNFGIGIDEPPVNLLEAPAITKEVLELKIIPDMDSNRQITDAVVGEKLYLAVEMSDGQDIFDDFFLHSCFATNQDNTVIIQLVDDNGCANTDIPSMVLSASVRSQRRPKMKYISIAAFKFPEAETVQFTCQAKLCKPDQLQCSAQCRSVSTRRNRVRRDVDDVLSGQQKSKDPDETEIHKSIRVRTPSDELTPVGEGPTDKPDSPPTYCFTLIYLTIAAAFLLALLISTIVSCVCLCTKYSNIYREREKLRSRHERLRQEMACYMNPGMFKIPRPMVTPDPPMSEIEGITIRTDSPAVERDHEVENANNDGDHTYATMQN